MDDAAIAAAFIARYHEDLRAGKAATLADYQALFPDHDALIAHEYADVQERLATERDGSRARPAGAPESPSGSGPARRIGHYEVLRELGRGGQGAVYLARDGRLGRRVALKVLTGWGGNSSEVLQRFQREAEIASRLDHPGICAVYEAAVDEGVPYIAMRFVDGESLAARLAKAKPQSHPESVSILDLESDTAATGEDRRSGGDPSSGPGTRKEIHDLLEIVEKAARALHVAHEAGVVHRDIKPGNIIVTREGEPVILDFGLARAMDEDLPTLTRTGDVFGTPAYMSPEQLRGDVRAIDRRTDVWALGVVLYEALAGRRPFTAVTRHRLADAILRQDAEDPRHLNPSMPRDLAVVLLTALEKEPARRYQTALDLAEELRRVRTFEPVQARPAGRVLKLRRWSQRNPALAATLYTSSALLGIALGFTITRMIAAQAAEAEAKSALATAESERSAKESALVRVTSESAAKDEALRRAEAHRLAALSNSRLAASPGQALLLAIEAERTLGSEVTRQAVWEALCETRERRSFIGHSGAVVSVALNPDGNLALTAGRDRTARLWEVATGREILQIPLGRIPERVGFHGGDRFFVVRDDGGDSGQTGTGNVSGDRNQGAISIHAVPGGETVWSSPSGCRAIVDSALTRILLLDDGAGRAEIVDWPAGTAAPGPGRPARDLARTTGVLSPDGALYACRAAGTDANGKTGDGPTRVVDLDTGSVVIEVKERVLAVNRPGRVLACVTSILTTAAASAGTKIIRSLDDGTELWKTTADWNETGGFDEWGYWEHFSPDGALALANDEWDVTIVDARKGDRLHRLLRPAGLSHRLPTRTVFTADSREIAMASLDGTVTLWDLKEGRQTCEFAGHEGAVYSIAHSADGQGLLTGAEDGTARLWTRRSGLDRMTSATSGTPLRTVACTPDGRSIVGTSNSLAQMPVWDVETLDRSRRIHGGTGRSSTVLSPDGKHLAIVSDNQPVIVVAEVGTGRRVARIRTPDEVIVSTCWSPDGEHLVSSHRAKPPAGGSPAAPPRVRVWRWRSSEEIAILDGHEDLVVSAAFDREGRRLLLASVDRTATLWDTSDWKLRRRLGAVEPIAPATPEAAGDRRRCRRAHALFTRDPDRAVHAFDDVVVVWDLRTGDRVRTFEVPDADPARGLDPVVLDPEERLIAAVAVSRGELCVWDFDTGGLLSRRSLFPPDPASPAERRRTPAAARLQPDPAIVLISPDGRYLVASASGGRLEIFRTGSWAAPWLTLGGLDALMTAATFTPDGRSLICGYGHSSRILKFPLDLDAAAASLAPRELTPDERDRFEIGTAEDRARRRADFEERQRPRSR